MDVHKHYFERKGVTDVRQQELIRSRRQGQYTLFGTVAFLFGLVPVLNYGLFYASTAGAALWAADLEVLNASGLMYRIAGPAITLFEHECYASTLFCDGAMRELCLALSPNPTIS